MLATADSVDHFAHSPSTLAAFAVLSVLAGLLAAAAPRRRAAVLLTGIALAAVLALTLPPADGWRELLTARWDWSAVPRALRPTGTDLTAWRTSSDGLLNVVLFVPLGAALTVLARRALVSVACCTALSTAIECYQAATGVRVGSAADVVSNTLGAVLGAGLGLAVLLAAAFGASLTHAVPRSRVTSR